MIKKIMLIGLLAAAIPLLGLSARAYAHFIVEDTNTGLKALFHVTPDHDPIAGEQSVISFDFSKTGFDSRDFSYALSVKSTKGEATTVPLDVVGNVVMANYAFPDRGFYDITLSATAKNDGTVSKINYGQRVSRGVVAERGDTVGIIGIGAIVGTIVIAVGAILFSLKSDYDKRKEKKK